MVVLRTNNSVATIAVVIMLYMTAFFVARNLFWNPSFYISEESSPHVTIHAQTNAVPFFRPINSEASKPVIKPTIPPSEPPASPVPVSLPPHSNEVNLPPITTPLAAEPVTTNDPPHSTHTEVQPAPTPSPTELPPTPTVESLSPDMTPVRLPVLDMTSSSSRNPYKPYKLLEKHHHPLVREIGRIQAARDVYLRSKGNHGYGERFNILACVVTRNEMRFKEWMLRNFVSGIEHFIIYDNNHVLENIDLNMTEIMKPFIDAGLVTYLTWPFESKDYIRGATMGEQDKYKIQRHCITEFGPYTDWLTFLDTDEYIVSWKKEHHPLQETKFLTKGEGASLIPGYPYDIHPLFDKIKDLGRFNAFGMPWMMNRPPPIMLRPTSSYLDAFRVPCQIEHRLNKLLLRANDIIYWGDHELWDGRGGVRRYNSRPAGTPGADLGPADGVQVVHYYARSLEEWMLKKEQSYLEYPRALRDRYDGICQHKNLSYPPGYEEAYHRLDSLSKDISQSGISLSPNVGPMPLKPFQHEDSHLYWFFKWALSERLEWDEEAYFLRNPSAINDIVQSLSSDKPMSDSMHHYIQYGFQARFSSCWIRTKELDPKTRKFCF